MIRHVLVGLLVPAAVNAQDFFEFRAGGIAWQTLRTSTLGTQAGRVTGALTGGEGVLRIGALGLSGRVVGGAVERESGAAAPGDLVIGEGTVSLGPRQFALEGTYVRRVYTGALASTTRSTILGGLRMTMPIGRTGAELRLRGWVVAPWGEAEGAEPEGYGGESMFLYDPPRIPLYLTFGYRAERLTMVNGSFRRPEGAATLVAGGGFALTR